MVLSRGWRWSRWCERPVWAAKGIWCELPSASQGNKCITSQAALHVLKMNSELSKRGVSIVLPLLSGNLPGRGAAQTPLLRRSEWCVSTASPSACKSCVVSETLLLHQLFSSGEILSCVPDRAPCDRALCSSTFSDLTHFAGPGLSHSRAACGCEMVKQ